MRLSGLAAGIATFGVLEITHNLLQYENRIGPGLNTFSSVPETTGLTQATIGAVLVIAVAYVYARSRFGRLLRATREDPAAARAVGISIYRQRLGAFALSGLLAGFAGGLYIHLLPLQAGGLYLDLTFITLAMLVIGGTNSLWGAVVGALAVSGLDSLLAVAENGLSLFGTTINLHSGTRVVVEGVLMAVVLILRPSGLTGGREFSLRAHGGAHDQRVCVAGAGVIGSLLAGHLARVAEVTVLVRRGEHARALNERACGCPGAPISSRSVQAALDPAELPEPDLVIVACKGRIWAAVADRLAGHFPTRR